MKAFILFPLLALSLSSCKDNSNQSPPLDQAAQKTEQASEETQTPAETITASTDTVHALALEFVEVMKPMPQVLDSAEDIASAEAAVVEIKKIKDAIVSIGERAEKLEAPSNEERAALHEEMTQLTEANGRELTRVILENHAKFKDKQEILELLEAGLTEFHTGMVEITPIIMSHFSPDPDSEETKESPAAEAE